ncbi:hypothetical protein QFE97_00195 [Bacillus subtilis]|nr:hypothetical protein QFE97_00195 [Bacillus subtilis]
MTEALDAVQARILAIANVRGLLPSPCARPWKETMRNTTPGAATLRDTEPDPLTG